ncbi:hypothetical protein FS749_014459 [Ceratobasidium sp. UAMH 11750]|nr:hypothetical protein FS749_014459 [Ceratobasidium sp. UAMH 11750]
MKDSAGYTGGTSSRFTVAAGSSNCSLTTNQVPPPSLSFTRTGNSQCGNVNIVVHNGTSPYQVEIIPEVRQQKTLHFATNSFGFVLDLPSALSYFVAVTDAEGNSAVDGILAVGSSSDNSCLNAAKTMSVGMFTSVFTGSGVLMPSTTLSGGTASAATSAGAAATQQGTSNSSKHSNTRMIAEIVGAVAALIIIAALVFLICCRRRRKRRAASGTNQPESESVKPEMNQANSGYALPYTPQYGYTGAPQIQEADIRSGTSIGGSHTTSAVATSQSYDPYASSPPVHFNGVTMHAPQARSAMQTVSYYSTSSTGQQSPVSHGFSDHTGATASLLGAQHSLDGGSTTPSWGVDRKERVTSSPHDGASQAHSWEMAASPPPRSITGTVPPPYVSNAQS